MRVASRRKAAIFFLTFGSCLIGLAVALIVGWIFLSLEQIALLVFGIIFFSLIITGLVLNTIFLVREIRRNEQHDAFLNAVTHELKTPIASIRLYLETLKSREILPEKRTEFYDTMLADSDRLLNTVEQVLFASRAREQKKLVNISELHLQKILDDSVERISSRYGFSAEEITITSRADGIVVSGDAEELGTVFTNLLDNAVKYSGKDVKVSLNVKSLNEKFAIVRIKDSGIGMPPSEVKRIFKRFYRVPNVSTQRKKGTGLGLFIVRSIIKKHNGKIWADSKGLGFGSEFTVQLPKLSNEKGV